MTRVQYHVVLDCLETTSAQVLNRLELFIEDLGLSFVELLYLPEKIGDHGSILVKVILRLRQLPCEGAHG